jgi:predicted ATPase
LERNGNDFAMTTIEAQAPGIRTPDQRLRVFISSTLTELAEERLEVRAAIEALRLQPVLFELGARPPAPQELYRAYLEQSHIFVGMYWKSYGWIGPGVEISGIHDEYRRAAGKPRLLYVKHCETEREPELQALIRTFEIEGKDSYAVFRDAIELRRLVEVDLATLMSERFLHRLAEQPNLPLNGPARLPGPITDLIGRDRELEEIRALTGGCRCVTITGPGGTGKTRIAIEVARTWTNPDAEGAWFVDLSGLSRGQLVTAAVEQTLGVVAPTDTVERLASVINQRHMLLVLDNCEHVIEEVSKLTVELLTRCPDLRVLCTSRQPLHIRGECTYPLLPLPVATELPDGTYTPGPAMLLLEQLARSYLPEFRLDDANRDSVRAICAELDGLPLGIELAAARLRVLSPDQVRARLDQRFSLLAGGPRDLPERQRTLVAAIDWSFNLLILGEQRLFLQLSVFRGGFDMDAVCEVAGLSDLEALDLLTELVEKSLVIREAGTDRYRMLESLREYAQWRLSAEERQELAGRHLRWVARMTASLGSKLFGAEAAASFARLLREQDNVRAALACALERADGDAAVQIGGRLGWFWYRRGQVAEGRQWIEAALALPSADAQSDRALALVSLAALHYLGGDLKQATDTCMAARLEAERSGDTISLGRALTYAAYFMAGDGNLQQAEDLVAQALELGVAHAQPLLRAQASMTLGQILRQKGQLGEAEQMLLAGAAIAAECGNHWLQASSLWIAAKIALEVEDVALALQRLRLVLRLQSAEGDISSTLVGLHTTAAALADAGLPERGAMLLGAVAAIGSRVGYHPARMDADDAERVVARVRRALDEAAFDQAFTAGQLLNLNEALALAGHPSNAA